MNKIVVLENEWWGREGYVNDVLEALCKKFDCESEILERVGNIPKEDIINSLSQCDKVFFSTTWTYTDATYSLGKLLSSSLVGPKNIYYLGDSNVAYQLERVFSTEELATLSKHRLFLADMYSEVEEYEEFDLSVYAEQWGKDEEERILKNKSFSKTGRTVRIKTVVACGPQWSNLNPEDVVDELDCSSIDPNPNRGVWVMGLDEPVKLLNDSGYEEWEFAEAKCDWLSLEFHLRACRGQDKHSINTLGEWVNSCSGKLRLSNSELWEECDNICTLLGVERRGNRSYFERRLREYREKYIFFKEREPRSIKNILA